MKGTGNKVIMAVIRDFAEQLANERIVKLPDEFHLDHPQFNQESYT
jgi:hypothetical protein